MSFYIKIFIFLFLLIPKIAISLELVLPVYIPFSKSNTISLPGSSSSTINKYEIDQNNKTINHLLDLESSITNRSIYGINSSSSKSTIDIRGMGAQAKSNVLILVNGQKLNNIDMSEIDFASIPIENLEKIEVIKGNAASVLYGDGAIGGAVNFITNSSPKNQKKNISFKTGSFNSNEFILTENKKINNYDLEILLNSKRTDGYRDENEQMQNNVSLGLSNYLNKSNQFLTFSFNEQIMSTPGDRDQDQLYNDRRGSDTPNDFINSIGSSLTFGSNYQINNNLNFIIDSSLRLKNSYSDLQSTSYPSYNDTALYNFQISPRVSSKYKLFNKRNVATTGLDLKYSIYKSYRKKNQNAIPLHTYNAWSTGLSLYHQNTISINNSIDLGFGARLQKNKIAIGDFLNSNAPDYAGWQKEHTNMENQSSNFAYYFGLEKLLSNNYSIYGRYGSGFRYPNIDDRIGGSGDTSLDLETQKSNDYEIGLKRNSVNYNFGLSGYIINSKNEIGYDSDEFKNINISDTKRFGVELTSKFYLFDKFTIKNNGSFNKAKYTSENHGDYATNFKDNDIPLVPQYSFTSVLEYKINQSAVISPSLIFQDDMRMESDDENFQNTKIPAHTLINLDLNYETKKLNYFIVIENLFDSKFYNYAVASSNTQGRYNTYPEPGRQFNIGVKSKF